MRCLHPHCPMGTGLASWKDVLDHHEVAARPRDKTNLLPALAVFGKLASPAVAKPIPIPSQALIKRMLRLCPCLYNQLDIAASAEATAHFCEITLKTQIVSANVYDAFLIQHPKKGSSYLYPPFKPCNDGGTIMEVLCSEVLTGEGIPLMQLGGDNWPEWQAPGHIRVNAGKMSEIKALGDIPVPCAPTNLLISVKSEAARERLLYSANSIEGIGFGFFDQPQEFWSPSRMLLFKRMGFSAIYMPGQTHAAISQSLKDNNRERLAVNLNGTDLYRPFEKFGEDMKRVAGKTSFRL